MPDRFTIEDLDGIILINVLAEKFDFYTIPSLNTKLNPLLELRGLRPVIVNLGRCNYIDSSAFGLIINLMNILRKQGKEIIIVNSNSDIAAIMNIMRVEKVIPVMATVEEARARLKAGNAGAHGSDGVRS
jgi:anti-sigma B factor antagonist